MKRIFNISVVCLIIALMSFSRIFSWAAAAVSITGELTGHTLIGGSPFVQPGNQFSMKYTIGRDNRTITRVKVNEILRNSKGTEVSRQETIFTGELGYGYAFRAESGETSYSLEYNVECTLDGGEIERTSGKQTVNVVNSQLSVSYRTDVSAVQAAGQEVTYTATVKSQANVPLYDIKVSDSVHGHIGTIASLSPNEVHSVSRSFKINQTTDSHVTLSFTDPTGRFTQKSIEGSNVRVQAPTGNQISSLAVSGSVDKPKISAREEVTFSLKLQNSGSTTLVDIAAVDWNGNKFYSVNELLPGQEVGVEYKAQVDPGKAYEIVVSGTVKGTSDKVSTSYSAEIRQMEPLVEIDRSYEPQTITAGDQVTMKYVIRNTGTIPLLHIKLSEPEFGEIGSVDRLDPGQEQILTIQKVLEQEAKSKPLLTAVQENTGDGFSFEAEEMIIPVKVPEGVPHLSVRLVSEPERLEEAGTVKLICTIENDGAFVIENIAVKLKERDFAIGSILRLEPGEKKVFTTPEIDVDGSQSFTALARGRTEKGDVVEFLSSPLQIPIGEDDSKGKLLDGWGSAQDGKATLLKVILIVIALLIILTAGALIYLMRGSLPFIGKKDKKRSRIKGGKHRKQVRNT